MIQHKNPVEESFVAWISATPESFHPLDMRRFYVFVHSVISYHAKSWRSYEMFKEKCSFYKPNITHDIIRYYYNLMDHLIAFSGVSSLPLYENDDCRETTVITVEKGMIVTRRKTRQ